MTRLSSSASTFAIWRYNIVTITKRGIKFRQAPKLSTSTESCCFRGIKLYTYHPHSDTIIQLWNSGSYHDTGHNPQFDQPLQEPGLSVPPSHVSHPSKISAQILKHEFSPHDTSFYHWERTPHFHSVWMSPVGNAKLSKVSKVRSNLGNPVTIPTTQQNSDLSPYLPHFQLPSPCLSLGLRAGQKLW